MNWVINQRRRQHRRKASALRKDNPLGGDALIAWTVVANDGGSTVLLDRYRPENHATPLKNPATSRLFAFFIAETAGSLTGFDKLPLGDASSGGILPDGQKGFWNYEMPTAAIRDPGLLQAMLALASLQIAGTRDVSTTPSVQHYVWALKRVHAAVGDSRRRLKPETVAASLLLSQYELMSGAHNRWNLHLRGTRQLFDDIDFVSMTLHARRMKAEWEAFICTYGPHARYSTAAGDQVLRCMEDADDEVVRHLTGLSTPYSRSDGNPPCSPQFDLIGYDCLKNLWWMYCKHDVCQSLVSGGPLMFVESIPCAPGDIQF